MSTSAQQVLPLTIAVERRFYPRIVPQTPIFVAFHEDESEESLLLNVSENGLLVSTPAGLRSNSVARLSLRLNGLPKSVQVTVRVLWASEEGNLAGIQLLNLSEHDRQLIRKWGARESANSWQPEREHASLVAAPSRTSLEGSRATSSLAEGAPARTTRDLASMPLAPPHIVRRRSTSILERCVIWGLYFAAACLVTIFFLKNEVLGNLLSHLGSDRSQTSVALTLTQEAELTPHTPSLSSRTAGSPATPVHELINHKSANTAGQAARQVSAKRAEAPSEAADDASLAETQSDLSPIAALPAPSEAAAKSEGTSPQSSPPAEVPKEAAPETDTTASPDPPTAAETVPNPARASVVPSATSATTPSSSSTGSIAAPIRPALPPNSDASVIQPVIRMDPPRNQTLEVHLPSGHQASFLNLPGERIIESPKVTMHILRSVLMPASGGGWFANRNKKVVVGELISRVDPQAAQIPTGPSTSVRVKATVTKDGRIENVNLILGSPSLAPAIAKALREWRFQPTIVDNKPVETQCDVVFQFRAPQYRAAKR